MTRRSMKRALLAALPLASALGTVVATPPAGADPNPLTITVSHTEAHPGDEVTVDVTFTNPETVPVTFSYLSGYPTWETAISNVRYAITSCTGDISACWMLPNSLDNSPVMLHQVAIPPGATRSVEIVYQVLPTSPCGGGRAVGLIFYTYRESTAGNFDEIVPAPTGTDVVC